MASSTPASMTSPSPALPTASPRSRNAATSAWMVASSVSAEIKELRSKVDLIQLQQEENLGAVNDLSEDVRQDIDNLYLAIADLSSRIEEKKNEHRPKIGFK